MLSLVVNIKQEPVFPKRLLCWLNLHHIIWLFHCTNIKINPIHCSKPSICGSHRHIIKIFDDFIIRNIFGPISSFLSVSLQRYQPTLRLPVLQACKSQKLKKMDRSEYQMLFINHFKRPTVAPLLSNTLYERKKWGHRSLTKRINNSDVGGQTWIYLGILPSCQTGAYQRRNRCNF